MLEFMMRFQKHLQEMEQEFESGVTSTYQMNQIMNHYEATLFANYAHQSFTADKYRVFETDV
jgi:hypothetical protein